MTAQLALPLYPHSACPEPPRRVRTSTGRTGAILPSPWWMPHHSLVKFDSGEVFWILTEILKPITTEGNTHTMDEETRKKIKERFAERDRKIAARFKDNPPPPPPPVKIKPPPKNEPK